MILPGLPTDGLKESGQLESSVSSPLSPTATGELLRKG